MVDDLLAALYACIVLAALIAASHSYLERT